MKQLSFYESRMHHNRARNVTAAVAASILMTTGLAACETYDHADRTAASQGTQEGEAALRQFGFTDSQITNPVPSTTVFNNEGDRRPGVMSFTLKNVGKCAVYTLKVGEVNGHFTAVQSVEVAPQDFELPTPANVEQACEAPSN